jgi:alkanesulfonate monooxygenase SsuD/methylene tetrahydromethanopterin reductase-like flavin-dependent oxidoreductase (luciferase family)
MKVSLMGLGDQVRDPVTGIMEDASQRHRAMIEAAVVADQTGYHSVHVGEHHGLAYIYSAPPVMLSAIGERTRRVKLSTAVTLAANLDPVRCAEDYATVDVLSGGRCEVVVGRGNFFVTTYRLFGQRIEDSHELFRTSIELLLKLWTQRSVDYEGPFRAPIQNFELKPPPVSGMRIWIGGGASQSTAELAARLGLDLMLPSAFGNPAQFKPIVELYRERFASYGHGREPAIGACWHVNVAKTSQAARATWEPRYHAYFDLVNQMIVKATPDPPPFVHRPFDFERLTTKGPAIVGSPDEVADRLRIVAAELTSDLNLLSIDMGGQPTKEFLAMTELIGTQVIPQLV